MWGSCDHSNNYNMAQHYALKPKYESKASVGDGKCHLSSLLHYRVEHSKSCHFGRLPSIRAVFRLITKFLVLKLTVFMVQCQNIKGILVSQFMTPLTRLYHVINIKTIFTTICLF